MCMLTRPLMSKGHNNQPDALRESMYTTVKRLFWEPGTIHEAATTIIKAGLFLSIYEYGHGMLNPSYMTMNPINIDEAELMNNDRLELELESAKSYLSIDSHYFAYHLQARAAIWLELVLRVVRDPNAITAAGRLRFQAVDRGLLRYLTIILGLGMGTCCEAIAIGLNAFVHLHRGRLKLSNSFHFSEQDKLESSRALETMLRILSDFFDDQLFKNPGFIIASPTDDNGIFRETFPYFVHMTYVILLELKEHGRFEQLPTSSEAPPLEKEVEALWSILNFAAEHWQIARTVASNWLFQVGSRIPTLLRPDYTAAHRKGGSTSDSAYM
uniref:Uncharacterized protein n=1 Tax=Talaromyces marneffei PM1 TaxID=1077442 RepID=A0A093V5K4_TALMA